MKLPQGKWIAASLLLGVVVVLIAMSVTSHSGNQQSKLDDLVTKYYRQLVLEEPYEENRQVAEEIYQLGIESGDELVEARGLIRLAFTELIYGRWANDWKAKLEKAESICGNKQSTAYCELLMFRGFKRGNWDQEVREGTRELDEAIRMAKQLRNDQTLSFAHSYLALLYNYDNRDEVSLEQALIGLKIADSIEDDALAFMSLRLTANTLRMLDQEETAVPYVERMIELQPHNIHTQFAAFGAGLPNRLEEESIRMLKKLNAKTSKRQMDWARIGRYTVFLKMVNQRKGNYEVAMELLEKAQDCYLKAKSFELVKRLEGNRISLLIEMGEFDTARSTFHELVDVQGESKLRIRMSDRIDILENLGDYEEALRWTHRLLGHTREEMRAKIKHVEVATEEFLQAELRNREFIDFEKAQQDRASFQWYLLLIILACAAVLVAVGVTRYRTLEQSRNNLERLVNDRTESLRVAYEAAELAAESKGEFLARVNHEIRNPLQAILGYSDLIQHHSVWDDSEKRGRYLSGIRSSSEHLMSLVNDVLEVTEIARGAVIAKEESFDVDDVMNDVLVILSESAESKGLEIDFHSDLEQTKFFGDSSILRQILINLAGNAIKQTSVGFVKTTFSGEADSAGNTILLKGSVEDSGPGIPHEYHKYLFEPFAKLPNSHLGKGLGLHITKLLVETLGGKLEFETEVGFGSRFMFEIPYRLNSQATVSFEKSVELDSSLKILVVDDKQVIREIACRQLVQLGYQSDSCGDLPTTIEKITSWQPDIVLLDLRMPEHDGFHVLQKIWAEFVSPPRIIAMTGDATAQVRRSVVEAGFNGFIAKPFRLSQLKKLVEQASQSTSY